MREDPGWGGPLVRMASSSATSTAVDGKIPFKEVFYNNSEELNPWGIPIYVRHGSTPRKATAHVIRLRGRQYFLSACHAFFDDPAQRILPSTNTRDNEFEIDGDDEGDIGGSGASTISTLSFTSDSFGVDDACSGDSERSTAPSAVFSTASSALSPIPTSQARTKERPQITFSTKPALEKVKIPRPKSIVRLGTLVAWSIDQDWALIEPVQTLAQSNVERTLPDYFLQDLAKIPKNVRTVFTHTRSGGRMVGIVSASQSLIRVPRATSFQSVYSVRFNGTLANGDCGSSVFEMPTGNGVKLVGHIVAGCLSTGFAYVMAAENFLIRLENSLDQLRCRTVKDNLPVSRSSPVYTSEPVGLGPLRLPPSVQTIQEGHRKPTSTILNKATMYSRGHTEFYSPVQRALNRFH